jgi:hypothetical protein
MLSQRYVDLLDCSELIQDLRHYSVDINEIANANEKAIKHSFTLIKEDKPNTSREKDSQSSHQEKQFNQVRLLELVNSNNTHFSPIEKVLLLSCLSTKSLSLLT